MRIGLSIETDSPGGAETMILALARRLQQGGHVVTSLGPTGGEGWLTARFREMGIERDLVEFSGPLGFGSIPRIAAVLRRRRLDVLHSHDWGMAVTGALAAKVARTRHIITMHGGLYYADAARRRWALRVAAAMSTRTVAVSQASRATLATKLHLPESSIDLVHNGLDARPGDATRVRSELRLVPGTPLVIAIGSLYEVKGHVYLLEAAAKLRAEGRDLVVAIAGSGYMEERLKARAAELGLAEGVRFLGYRSDVPDLLAAADVYAMPSLSEGLPMAMIEAMLAGKAIVASDVGGIPELLPSPEHGVLAKPGDAGDLAAKLATLLADPTRRARLGAAAQARAAEHFTAAAMTEKYLALYEG